MWIWLAREATRVASGRSRGVERTCSLKPDPCEGGSKTVMAFARRWVSRELNPSCDTAVIPPHFSHKVPGALTERYRNFGMGSNHMRATRRQDYRAVPLLAAAGVLAMLAAPSVSSAQTKSATSPPAAAAPPATTSSPTAAAAP